VLHTVADPGGDPAKLKGGVGLVLNQVSSSGSGGVEDLLAGAEWTVKDTRTATPWTRCG
jgi:hypothetical protein